MREENRHLPVIPVKAGIPELGVGVGVGVGDRFECEFGGGGKRAEGRRQKSGKRKKAEEKRVALACHPGEGRDPLTIALSPYLLPGD